MSMSITSEYQGVFHALLMKSSTVLNILLFFESWDGWRRLKDERIAFSHIVPSQVAEFTGYCCVMEAARQYACSLRNLAMNPQNILAQ